MSDADALRGKHVLLVHGIEDQKLGIHLARSARDQLAESPLAVDYRELPMGHGITAESLVVVTTWISGLLEGSGVVKR